MLYLLILELKKSNPNSFFSSLRQQPVIINNKLNKKKIKVSTIFCQDCSNDNPSTETCSSSTDNNDDDETKNVLKKYNSNSTISSTEKSFSMDSIGNSSAARLKEFAFNIQLMDFVKLNCKIKNCKYDGKCISSSTILEILELRTEFWGDRLKRAPAASERRQKIIDILLKAKQGEELEC